ncbi:hypothetical protein REPUB_Repub01dG0236700 [Reevesia pubescens]
MLFEARSCSKVVGFRIFRLDEEEQKWDEMESLGDQILFLGVQLSFSVSASEFSWGKGNLIFFVLPLYDDIFVFDLETGIASPSGNFPTYHNLFWPPPEWVTSPESVNSSGEVISNSTYSVPSATPEAEYKYPDSSSAICTREVGGKSPESLTSAGQEVGNNNSSPSSKCSFKFCCF